MIWEVLTGVGLLGTVINGIALILMYRQYLSLASEPMEFEALVIESLEELEDGNIRVDPLSLAAISMDHISRLSGILTWIRM